MEHPDRTGAEAAAREIGLDEAALLDGPLYEIYDPDTGRVVGVCDIVLAAHHGVEQIVYDLAEQTRRQLAANGEGHTDFWIRIHVRDQDTGQHHGGAGVAVSPPERAR